MKFTISNFRRIKSAEISPAAITLLAGKNGDGKTSILQAIAAVTTGLPPMSELKKNESGMLVHTGQGRGEIKIESPVGNATISYPDGKRATDGAPVEISDMAAGLKSFITMTVPERVQYINDLMHNEPRQEELEDILGKIGIQVPVVARIWQTIKAQGWDAAWKQARESGSKLKGGWEEITGDRYGSQIAASWMPAEWETDLEAATEEQLKAELAHERSWLEAAISYSAVNSAEIARLQNATEMLPKLQAEYDEIKKTLEALFKNESDLQHAIRDIPQATQQATVPCPHCSQPVVISGNKLLKPGAVANKDAVKRAEKIKATEESLAAVKQEILRINTELGHKKAAVDAANKAAQMLAGMKSPQETKKTDHPAVEDCRARVARAENRLAARSRRNNASAKHDAIGKNQQIIDVLAPDGLRMLRLKEALTLINKQLADIAAATGWLPVEIEDDMSISYGDYQYVLLSNSTQYRVQISLQTAFTLLDHSVMLLIDGADILDSTGRNGLFKMLAGIPVTASTAGFLGSIVAMTINKQTDIPAIEKLGGCAYWVENGTAVKAKG